MRDIRKLVAKMAPENLGWGYTKIRDALRTGLKIEIGRTTVADILAEEGIEPAPERREQPSAAHPAADFRAPPTLDPMLRPYDVAGTKANRQSARSDEGLQITVHANAGGAAAGGAQGSGGATAGSGGSANRGGASAQGSGGRTGTGGAVAGGAQGSGGATAGLGGSANGGEAHSGGGAAGGNDGASGGGAAGGTAGGSGVGPGQNSTGCSCHLGNTTSTEHWTIGLLLGLGLLARRRSRRRREESVGRIRHESSKEPAAVRAHFRPFGVARIGMNEQLVHMRKQFGKTMTRIGSYSPLALLLAMGVGCSDNSGGPTGSGAGGTNPGSGGASASGGSPGNGGSASSGGSVGSGGSPGSGGVASSGGSVGSGGSPRSGGVASSGGSVGSGGSPGSGGLVSSGGAKGSGGSAASGGASGSGGVGGGAPSGGSTGRDAAVSGGGSSGSGGAAGSSGGAGGTAGTTGTGGSTGTSSLPGDIAKAAGTPMVAAHSMTRAMFASYTGPLFKAQRASDGQEKDIGTVAGSGLVDTSTLNTFCSGTSCKVATLYDQTDNHNDMWKGDTAANAPMDNGEAPKLCHLLDIQYWQMTDGTKIPIAVEPGQSGGLGSCLRNREKTKNMPIGASPITQYGIFHKQYLNGGCCFNYGNTGKKIHYTGPGTLSALNFSKENWWSEGKGNGPWVMVDWEAGVYAGNICVCGRSSACGPPNGADCANSGTKPNDNPSVTYDIVTALMKCDGTAHWALKNGNAKSGPLAVSIDLPTLPKGYSPLKQEGGLGLGEGGAGDNGGTGGFSEGAVIAAQTSDATDDAIQKSIVSVFGK